MYESFTNTIAYLEEQGLYDTYMRENPVAEDVAYLEINKDDYTYIGSNGWNMDDGESEHYYIYDPEEIEAALDYMVPSIGKSYTWHWHITKDYDPRYSVYIYLYDDSDNCYERAFLKGQVPEFLANYETTTY